MTNLRGIESLIMLFIVLFFTSAEATAQTLEEDLAAIEAFNQAYVGAINDGDIDTLSSLTTEEHIIFVPGREPVVGKAANDASNRRAFEMFDFDEAWYPIETEVAGDWAWQRGTYTVEATPKAGGESNSLAGTFLRIYRRQPDGSWRMIRDMFNSSPVTSNMTE